MMRAEPPNMSCLRGMEEVVASDAAKSACADARRAMDLYIELTKRWRKAQRADSPSGREILDIISRRNAASTDFWDAIDRAYALERAAGIAQHGARNEDIAEFYGLSN